MSKMLDGWLDKAYDKWHMTNTWQVKMAFRNAYFRSLVRSWLEEAWGIPVETVILFIVEIHPSSGAHEYEFHSEDIHSSPGRWIVCELQCWKKLPAPPNKIHVVRLCENHKMASVRYWWIFEDVRYRWRCENLRYWWNCGDCVCVEMPPVDFACTRPRSAGGKIGYSFPL